MRGSEAKSESFSFTHFINRIFPGEYCTNRVLMPWPHCTHRYLVTSLLMVFPAPQLLLNRDRRTRDWGGTMKAAEKWAWIGPACGPFGMDRIITMGHSPLWVISLCLEGKLFSAMAIQADDFSLIPQSFSLDCAGGQNLHGFFSLTMGNFTGRGNLDT